MKMTSYNRTICSHCESSDIRKITIRMGSVQSLSFIKRIIYNTIKKNYYMDFYKCNNCRRTWESDPYYAEYIK